MIYYRHGFNGSSMGMRATMVYVKQITAAAELVQAQAIRRQVFMEVQGI